MGRQQITLAVQCGQCVVGQRFQAVLIHGVQALNRVDAPVFVGHQQVYAFQQVELLQRLGELRGKPVVIHLRFQRGAHPPEVGRGFAPVVEKTMPVLCAKRRIVLLNANSEALFGARRLHQIKGKGLHDSGLVERQPVAAIHEQVGPGFEARHGRQRPAPAVGTARGEYRKVADRIGDLGDPQIHHVLAFSHRQRAVFDDS